MVRCVNLALFYFVPLYSTAPTVTAGLGFIDTRIYQGHESLSYQCINDITSEKSGNPLQCQL